MKTLYDLLGARADDDAEALKRAFRKAVKAHHPDLHAGDPDAPLRFRQIVAANAVLRDAKQRATYDRLLQRQLLQRQLPQHHPPQRRQLRRQLLQLTRQQLRSKRMRTTVAVAVVGALVGGYALFAPITTTAVVAVKKDKRAATAVAVVKKDEHATTAVAVVKKDEHATTAIAAVEKDEHATTAIAAVKKEKDNTSGPAKMAAVQPATQTNTTARDEPHGKHDGVGVPNGVIELSGAAEIIADNGPARGLLPNDAKFYREQGIVSYRGGGFPRAVGDFCDVVR